MQNSILTANLGRHNKVELIASCAGLLLIPENAGCAEQIEKLVKYAVCFSSETGSGKVSREHIRQYLGNPDIDSFGMRDSYFEPFIDTISFFNGPFTVICGLASKDCFILKAVLTSIFSENIPEKFKEKARKEAAAILRLCNEIVRRAQINRRATIHAVYSEEPLIPLADTLERNRQALTFTETELDQLLNHDRTDVSELLWAVCAFDEVLAESEGVNANDAVLMRKPILRIDDQFIVASPLSLISTLRHRLLVLAKEDGLSEILAENFHNFGMASIDASLSQLRHKELGWRTSKVSNSISYGIYTFDSDKCLVAILVSDPLIDYNKDHVYGRDKSEYKSLLESVYMEILTGFPRGEQQFMFLLVMNTSGRAMSLNSGETFKDESYLYCTLEDLETISFSEFDDPLALWQFDQNQKRLPEGIRYIAFSLLDKFYSYKQTGYFGLPATVDPEELPLVSIDPGIGGKHRRDNQQKWDKHSVYFPISKTIIEVMATTEADFAPIYAERHTDESRPLAMLVEGFSLPVWTYSHTKDELPSSLLRMFAYTLVDTISYWIWELKPVLSNWFKECRSRAFKVRIILDGINLEVEATESNTPFSVSLKNGDQLRIIINDGFRYLLNRADNYGERELVRAILQLLASHRPSHTLKLERIDSIMETFLPLGIKKKALYSEKPLAVAIHANPPHFHPKREANVAHVQQDIAAFIRNKYDLSPGIVTDKQMISGVVKDTVEFLFNRIVRLSSGYDSQALLEYCLLQNESIIVKVKENDFTLPSQLACFRNSPERIALLKKEARAYTSQAVACRFLIEYFSSIRHKGKLRPPLSLYSDLIATAIELCDYGTVGDILHHELNPVELEVLPSRLIAIHCDGYYNAQKAFLPLYTQEYSEALNRTFVKSWEQETETSDADAEAELQVVNDACLAEFGFTIRQISKFFGFMTNYGLHSSEAICITPLKDAIAYIREVMSFSEDEAKKILDLFSLKTREAFLKAPTGFKSYDIYPWVFNRRLSYVRRPFIQRVRDDDEQLIWGVAHCHSAMMNFITLILNGHLRENDKKSDKMRAYCGRVYDSNGEEFEKEVEALFSGNNRYKVIRRFQGLGKNVLPDKGDIDVLLIDIRKKQIIPIECKSLKLARTPEELKSQIQFLFTPAKGLSVMEKHSLRSEWVKENLRAILEHLNVQYSSKWRVKPFIVTDSELFAPHFSDQEIPIISYATLQTRYRSASS